MADTCVPPSGTYGFDGNLCRVHCPISCALGETLCPGVKDDNGCQMEDTCIGPRYDSDGELCPAQCPIDCPNDNLHCPGIYDEKGCQAQDTCVPPSSK